MSEQTQSEATAIELPQVDYVRKYWNGKFQAFLSWYSCVPGTLPVIDRLRGKQGELLRARCIAFIESELKGEQTVSSVEKASSRVRRAVKGSFAPSETE